MIFFVVFLFIFVCDINWLRKALESKTLIKVLSITMTSLCTLNDSIGDIYEKINEFLAIVLKKYLSCI